MRLLLTVVLFVLCSAAISAADDAHTAFGDVPRTFSHFLNAREAALCRADVATGGLSAYFLNPAAASQVTGAAGVATMRFNSTSRHYLPEGDAYLDATDDGILFSQVVAVKRNGSVVFGFGYSCPSYQNLTLKGRQYVGQPPGLQGYEAELSSGLRYFEVILASRIGTDGRGGIGVAAGIANMNEQTTERVPGVSLDSARLDGTAASIAAGFMYDATRSFSFGLGYRWGSTVGVSGEWYKEDKVGESKTTPVAVAGFTFRPAAQTTILASYTREGWDSAVSTLAAYQGQAGLKRDEFDKDLATAAIGLERGFAHGRAVARLGASKQLTSGITNAIVPEYAVGLGGAVKFNQYSSEIALVRESYSEGGESGQVTSYGVYVTIGYEF
jgi:hypothetical protein